MRLAARLAWLGSARSKYRAIPTKVDGQRFDSRLEARYYGALIQRWRLGEVVAIERQPTFDLVVNGVLVARYVADFRITLKDGEIQVIDCKGFRTPTYRLKRRIFEALYPWRIVEVTR